MGTCASSKNTGDTDAMFDNLDLVQMQRKEAEQPLFTKEAESLLNDLQQMMSITPTRFHAIVLGNERVSPTPTHELQRLTKSIKHKTATPPLYHSTQYMDTMKSKLRNKTLIELCDVSRHLHNISNHNICVINLGAEIQRHFCTELPLLHSTMHLLHDIGFRSPAKQSVSVPKWNLSFSDLSYCEDILWCVEFEIHKRRPLVMEVDKLGGMDADKRERYPVNKWLVSMFDGNNCVFARTNLCLNDEGKAILKKIDEIHWKQQSKKGANEVAADSNYLNRNDILVVGYLKDISSSDVIPNTVSEHCQRFYPSNSLLALHRNTTHVSHLSVINKSFKLNIYDTKRDKVCHIGVQNIKGQHNKHNKESILFMVQNTSIPYWITDRYKNEWSDLNMNIYRNRQDLALLFVKSVEYENYVIIIDSASGYNHGYSVTLPSGTAVVSEMYSYSNRNMLCMDGESVMYDYNIDLDEYNKYTMEGSTYHGALPKDSAQDTFGCGIIAFGEGQTVLKCGGMDLIQSRITEDQARLSNTKKKHRKSRDITVYDYYDAADIMKLDHDSLSGEYVKGTACMNISKAYFDMFYVNELERIVAGPGGQTLLSMHTVEIYDIVKNKWNIIDVKTNYCYQSVKSLNHKNYKRSFLWTSRDNPFVIHLCNGKDYAELIDIREQKKWIADTTLNSHLEKCNLYGRVFM